MRNSVRSRAEEQFAATQKKDKQVLKEREKARQESEEHVARLRALRLAKEGADTRKPPKRPTPRKRPQRTISHRVCPRLTDANRNGRKGRNGTRHRQTAIGIRLYAALTDGGLLPFAGAVVLDDRFPTRIRTA